MNLVKLGYQNFFDFEVSRDLAHLTIVAYTYAFMVLSLPLFFHRHQTGAQYHYSSFYLVNELVMLFMLKNALFVSSFLLPQLSSTTNFHLYLAHQHWKEQDQNHH